MIPISSVRPFVTPEMRAAALPRPANLIPQDSLPLSQLKQLGPSAAPQNLSSAPTQAHDAFGSLLNRFVNEIDSKRAAASENVSALMAGENVSLHQTMISMEEASVSFQLMVEVRNKLLESYQELMRMQV